MFPQSIPTDALNVHFDLRFLLTEPEWREACRVMQPLASKPGLKLLGRLINAVWAIVLLLLPYKLGYSWSEMFRTHTFGTVPIAAMVCLSVLGATGIGIKSLNHHLNRLDLERQIIVSDQGVKVTLGERVRNLQWKDFVYFSETSALFVLRTSSTQFWTIPMRVLSPKDIERFRSLLCDKLPRRQPYSWSPDSSGRNSH